MDHSATGHRGATEGEPSPEARAFFAKHKKAVLDGRARRVADPAKYEYPIGINDAGPFPLTAPGSETSEAEPQAGRE